MTAIHEHITTDLRHEVGERLTVNGHAVVVLVVHPHGAGWRHEVEPVALPEVPIARPLQRHDTVLYIGPIPELEGQVGTVGYTRPDVSAVGVTFPDGEWSIPGGSLVRVEPAPEVDPVGPLAGEPFGKGSSEILRRAGLDTDVLDGQRISAAIWALADAVRDWAHRPAGAARDGDLRASFITFSERVPS
ncbi:hypothetical protein [Antribacter gilvus]|uniref:hypothetical protein n=1 Tax=Antribacter gilvus TaxID=2304675 RepID=UPI000F78E3AA|nr:hypothetical protein [Antribacter gilvus]